jgi:ATP-dependent HslUV protease, peptidase subunit HslV
MFSPHHSAAARALIDMPELDAEDVAKKAMNIAANMCVYTNHEFIVESMVAKKKEEA